jgi:SAM-dependent methyltransferase
MGERTPGGRASIHELIARLNDLVVRLRAEQVVAVPADEPYLASDSSFKGGVKRGLFRLVRPATRRYDRLATELASVTVELAQHLDGAAADAERLDGDVDRLDRALQAMQAAGPVVSTGVVGVPARVPDEYYWAFEGRMRGSSSSVEERLRQHERFSVRIRDAFGEASTPPSTAAELPLWLDLGCGLGEFCELVREWGWRVHGVDSSPGAIDACRAKGIDATLADISGYLETRRGEAPGVISAIQLIEHLPAGEWIPMFERVHAALRPGGAFLVETINGLNPQALAAYFIADVTHTWPGHPQTLALMAEHAGFARIDVVFLNPDERGNAQDFAICAVKDTSPAEDGQGGT